MIWNSSFIKKIILKKRKNLKKENNSVKKMPKINQGDLRKKRKQR